MNETWRLPSRSSQTSGGHRQKLGFVATGEDWAPVWPQLLASWVNLGYAARRTPILHLENGDNIHHIELMQGLNEKMYLKILKVSDASSHTHSTAAALLALLL